MPDMAWLGKLALISALFLHDGPPASQGDGTCTRLIDVMRQADSGSVLSAMVENGEGLPYKVNPYMSWRNHGRVGKGNSAKGNTAFVPWGQFFAAEGQQSYAPATVAIRNLKAYILSKKTQQWTLVTSTDDIKGALFLPNYNGNIRKFTPVVQGPSYTTAVLNPNYAFHFWPKSGRSRIDGPDVGGVVVSFDARILDPGSADTQYLFSAGGDYWKGLNSKWANYTTNGDAGIGRFIYVGNSWRTAFMTTASAADLMKCVD